LLRYDLKIGDHIYQLNADVDLHEKMGTIEINGSSSSVSFDSISETVYRIIVNGKPHIVRIQRSDNSKFIFLKGYMYRVEEGRLSQSPHSRKGHIEQLPQQVTPPMPSVVVRVMVKEGDRVEQGQGLVVVTAMKMETTLKAPYSGTVKKINTKVDAKVMPGDILVEIEKEEGNNG